MIINKVSQWLSGRKTGTDLFRTEGEAYHEKRIVKPYRVNRTSMQEKSTAKHFDVVINQNNTITMCTVH